MLALQISVIARLLPAQVKLATCWSRPMQKKLLKSAKSIRVFVAAGKAVTGFLRDGMPANNQSPLFFPSFSYRDFSTYSPQ